MVKTNLFVAWYHEHRVERFQELIESLYFNLHSPYIDHVYILSETTDQPIEHEKIIFSIQNHRVTYRDLFNAVNQVTTDSDINIIANTDIYFNHSSIGILKELINLENVCFALHRHEKGKKYIFRNCTQDAWIFKGKIKDKVYSDFCLGIPGCDNRIAYELKKVGYQLFNPSTSIVIFHHHESEIRNYYQLEQVGMAEYLKARIPPPHEFLYLLQDISRFKKK